MEDTHTKVCYTTSASAALDNFLKQDYCLVILDIHISDTENIKLLQTMHRTKYVPILVIFKSSKAKEKIKLLNAGADACIEKPLNLEVCVAQANSLIQRYVNTDANHKQHGLIVHGEELIINPCYRQVIIDGKNLVLTRKEFDLFYCLASCPKHVFTREQLYNQVWDKGPAIAIDEAVRSQIKRLRKKLASVEKNYIQTAWGVGYKFILSDHET